MYYVHKQIEMNTNKVIMTKLYGVSCCAIVCVIICVVSCCVGFTKIISVSDYFYNVWSNHENSTQINNTLCYSPSPSSTVVDCYDCVGTYDETIIMDLYVGK